MAAYHFCTIATPDYLPFAEALYASLTNHEAEAQLHVLVIDDENRYPQPGRIFYNPNDLLADALASSIIAKYATDADRLRWALKPAFLQHLLKNHDKVFYADNDLFFFSSPAFLFDELDRHSLLLSPHWCSFDPMLHEENFAMNFRLGMYNAGFLGATPEAKDFLKWWAQACLNRMERNPAAGYYDDQRYLDAALLLHPATGIIRQLGCNLGSWNIHQNQRTKVNGQVLINGKYPVVFVHFNGETIKHIADGNDLLLQPHLAEFAETVKAAGGNVYAAKHVEKPSRQSPSLRLKRSLRLRTRLKNFLLSLAKKL